MIHLIQVRDVCVCVLKNHLRRNIEIVEHNLRSGFGR
jgi:hypothetical protein